MLTRRNMLKGAVAAAVAATIPTAAKTADESPRRVSILTAPETNAVLWLAYIKGEYVWVRAEKIGPNHWSTTSEVVCAAIM